MLHTKTWEEPRAAFINIVPNTTGAAKVSIGLVIPELSGKLDGAANKEYLFQQDHWLELITILEKKPVTVEEVNVHESSYSTNHLDTLEEPLVSSDILEFHGSLFDATKQKLSKTEALN